MRKVYVTQRAQDDIELVSFGTGPEWRSRMGLLDVTVSAVIKEIGKNPMSGTQCIVALFKRSDEGETPAVVQARNIWTFHLKNVDPTATHRLLYRIVDDDVEIARLLHDEMATRDHVPVEWVIDLLRGLTE